MLQPPDEVRQHCIALSRLIDQGIRIKRGLEKAGLAIDQARPFMAQVPEWYLQIEQTLGPDEQAAIKHLRSKQSNPRWDKSWKVIIDLNLQPIAEARRVVPTVMQGISETLQELEALRLRVVPSSVVPEEVRRVFADTFHRMSDVTIDDLFLRQGCFADWWVPPLRPIGKQSFDHACGWIDGVNLYAPDELLRILERVYIAYLDYKGFPTHLGKGMLDTLAGLAAPPTQHLLQRYALHPRVEEVAERYWLTGDYDMALLKVCIALDNAVQAKSGSTESGTKLMQAVFAQGNAKLKVDPRFGEQNGFKDLFAGVMAAIRNPRAHHEHAALSEAEAVEWLAFLSALFRVLDATTLV